MEPAPKPPDQQSAWNTELAGWSDLQGRQAYQPIVIDENGRYIAYVGHHTGKQMNSITGVVEPNGTSIVDVTDPSRIPSICPTSRDRPRAETKAAALKWCASAAAVSSRMA